jgi:hypothetical protein
MLVPYLRDEIEVAKNKLRRRNEKTCLPFYDFVLLGDHCRRPGVSYSFDGRPSCTFSIVTPSHEALMTVTRRPGPNKFDDKNNMQKMMKINVDE